MKKDDRARNAEMVRSGSLSLYSELIRLSRSQSYWYATQKLLYLFERPSFRPLKRLLKSHHSVLVQQA